MVRPKLVRRISGDYSATFFKPAGVPIREIETVNLTFDELEAIRLTDYESMYQADAAKKMNISRQTLGSIVKSAHKKIASALVKGYAIKIDGGTIEYLKKLYHCSYCDKTFNSFAVDFCPQCKGETLTLINNIAKNKGE